jgi:putative lipase involved disintegration of autophagic bodies
MGNHDLVALFKDMQMKRHTGEENRVQGKKRYFSHSFELYEGVENRGRGGIRLEMKGI